MNLYIGSTLAVKPYGKVEFEYVTGEIMEIYLAILFSLLITGLIFLINAICCHTWLFMLCITITLCLRLPVEKNKNFY